MNKPHKHAEVIKAWADGAEIEWRILDHAGELGTWQSVISPSWEPEFEYRVKPVPLKFQKEAEAFYLDRKVIQCRSRRKGGKWCSWNDWVLTVNHLNGSLDDPDPRFTGTREDWGYEYEFRIKPEPVVKSLRARIDAQSQALYLMYKENGGNLKLTFEDGKLIKAEVLPPVGES